MAKTTKGTKGTTTPKKGTKDMKKAIEKTINPVIMVCKFAIEGTQDKLDGAVNYALNGMMMDKCEEAIAKKQAIINNEKSTEAQVTLATEELTVLKEELSKLNVTRKALAPVYKEVFDTMVSAGNSHLQVKSALNMVAVARKPVLAKYAVHFESEELKKALDIIHDPNNASVNGLTKNGKDTKKAVADADASLETIIKTYYSLPFESAYNTKFRVKLNATNKKILNDCYVTGVRNKVTKDKTTGRTKKVNQTTNTLVTAKKKDGVEKFDYTKLNKTVNDIVLPQYFA